MVGHIMKRDTGEETNRLSSVFSLISSIAQRVSDGNARAYESEKTNRQIARATNYIAILNAGLVFTGILSAVVLYGQWRTFEKTDKTLRIGERAFVYSPSMIFLKYIASSPNNWYIIPQAENNGSTQTVNMTYALICNQISSKATISLGPKQVSGIGGCLYNLYDLWHTQKPARVSGIIFYKDVFMQSHVSKFCRNFFIQADPTQARISADLSHTYETCPDAPDCSDNECSF
jgi:hypothetical protein